MAYDDELDRSELYMEHVSELDDEFNETRDLKGGALLIARDEVTFVEFYPEGVLEAREQDNGDESRERSG